MAYDMYDGGPISSTARSMMRLVVGGVKPVRNPLSAPPGPRIRVRFSDMHILSCVSRPLIFARVIQALRGVDQRVCVRAVQSDATEALFGCEEI